MDQKTNSSIGPEMQKIIEDACLERPDFRSALEEIALTISEVGDGRMVRSGFKGIVKKALKTGDINFLEHMRKQSHEIANMAKGVKNSEDGTDITALDVGRYVSRDRSYMTYSGPKISGVWVWLGIAVIVVLLLALRR